MTSKRLRTAESITGHTRLRDSVEYEREAFAHEMTTSRRQYHIRPMTAKQTERRTADDDDNDSISNKRDCNDDNNNNNNNCNNSRLPRYPPPDKCVLETSASGQRWSLPVYRRDWTPHDHRFGSSNGSCRLSPLKGVRPPPDAETTRTAA